MAIDHLRRVLSDGIRPGTSVRYSRVRAVGGEPHIPEFAREALEPEATPLIRHVVALQDHLGTQHDLHVAATLARNVAAGPATLSRHEIASIDRFAHQLDDGVVRLGRSLGRTWRPLVAPEYRRRLGRGLARL